MRALRILLYSFLGVAAVCGILFWMLKMPSAQQEAARLRDVLKITLSESDWQATSESDRREAIITDPREIAKFMALVKFIPSDGDCQCGYLRDVTFTTKTEEIQVKLGPHYFWVKHWGDTVNIFPTPPGLFEAYEAHFGRNVRTE